VHGDPQPHATLRASPGSGPAAPAPQPPQDRQQAGPGASPRTPHTRHRPLISGERHEQFTDLAVIASGGKHVHPAEYLPQPPGRRPVPQHRRRLILGRISRQLRSRGRQHRRIAAPAAAPPIEYTPRTPARRCWLSPSSSPAGSRRHAAIRATAIAVCLASTTAGCIFTVPWPVTVRPSSAISSSSSSSRST
jgi:hypothetical protein